MPPTQRVTVRLTQACLGTWDEIKDWKALLYFEGGGLGSSALQRTNYARVPLPAQVEETFWQEMGVCVSVQGGGSG